MTPSAEMTAKRGGPPAVHPVKIYHSDAGLARAVGEYVADGIFSGETVVVVSTEPHWESFAQDLRIRGVDPGERIRAGQIRVLHAGTTLARFMMDTAPNPVRFEEVIGTALDAASAWRPQAPLRVYGEMVDLLWQEGRLEAALRLEECWQQLMGKRRFSLLCGYKVSVMEGGKQVDAFDRICACHTAVITAFDGVRLADAIDRAIQSVLGSERAKLLRPLIAADVAASGLGAAEKSILWVRRNFPEDAAAILEGTKLHYEASGV